MDKPYDALLSEVAPMPGVAKRTDCILIVSGIRLTQETLALVFAHTLGCTNVCLAGSLPEVRAQIAAEQPKLVMIDATLRDGRAAARLLQDLDPTVRLIAFCADDAPDWASAGVSECLSRAASCKEIAAAVAAVMSREPQPCAAVPSGSTLAKSASCSSLTEREEEVARLIHTGLSNKDIARALGVSVPTVKSHVHNLLTKLGLPCRGRVATWYGSRRPLKDRRKPVGLLDIVGTAAGRDHTARPPSVI